MGQSLVGGLIGGAGGAVQGFISGGVPGALALGAVGFVGGFASSYMAKQATADALSSAMGPSAAEPKFGGYNVNRRGAALHHQVVYGQTKVGGVVVFDDAHGTGGVANTNSNKYLSRIIAYAGHEIESFEKIYIGGGYRVGTINSSTGAVTGVFAVDQNGADVGSELSAGDNPFNGYLSIREVLGGHTTSLDGQSLTNFSDDWTSSHRLLGIAHLAIVFEYAEDVWNEGLPEVTALIKGKKVYDPREAGHDVADPATWEWSNNPALIVRDFLTNSVYGLGEDDANIDDTLVDSSADTCDTVVGGTVDTKKYTCNGAWTTSQAPVDVIAQLMTSCAGYLWYAQGKWRMKAGKYVAPTVTLTEDDLRSPISVATRHSRRDNFNAVRGTFRGPKSNYQFTDYPTVKSTLPLSDSNNFVTVDGGQESTMDLALPFTDNPEEAQRLANIALEKNRSQITITGTFGLNAFDLQVGDNVSITNSRFGWTNKLFEVVAWSFDVEDYQLQVNLVLRETTSGTYDEYAHTDFESDNTNLPGVLGEVVVGGDVNSTTAPTGLTAGGGLKQIKVSWSNPLNNNYFETKVYRNTTNNFSGATNIVDVTGESYIDDNSGTGLPPDSQYFYWVKAVDSGGVDLGAGQIGPANAYTKLAQTDDIQGRGVTNPLTTKFPPDNAQNPSSYYDDVSPNDGAVTFIQLAITPVGTKVLISWDAYCHDGTNTTDPKIDFVLKRTQNSSTTTIQRWTDVQMTGVGTTFNGSVLDTAVSANAQATYKLSAQTITTGGTSLYFQIRAANITLTDLKR